MIQKLLVANRAEIASRVFATCRRLGIETVAVHSEADADLPFVADADVAVPLPGSTPAETYLRADLVLDAARRTGADAIHPGYGFLSENAAFARAVLDAGLTWVGPAPESIEQMGSKIAAKKLMADAGVPCLTDLDPAAVTEDDLPVLVKASAGGGGRGMRVVRTLDAVTSAVESATAEAASAFGDGAVFVEPYVERGRHVEVQVVGAADGVLVLGDRDCSLQRRHQKVVEEAPAPGLRDEVRAALHDAARAAAAAIDYRGAGTVEFLYDATTERFYFLEMNTRLQVEHPVTECVHGVDLVALQIAVAEGRALPEPREPRGHAVEVRLYAEDPSADYQPQSGTLDLLEVPDVAARFGALEASGLRLDAGFGSGDEVGTHYDAMLAKLISWAPTRDEAVRLLRGALRRAKVHGLVTNRDLLVEVLGHPRFVAADLDTGLLADEDLAAVTSAGPTGTARDQALAVFAAAVGRAELAAGRRTTQRGVPVGWRNVVSTPSTTTFARRGTELRVGWHGPTTAGHDDPHRAHYRLVDDEVSGAHAVSVTADEREARVVVEHDGVRVPHTVHETLGADPDTGRYDVQAPWGHLALDVVPRFVDPADQVAAGSLLAPMPGSVIRVAAQVGDEVVVGQPVLVLEAMKMQHTVSAPTDGVITELPVTTGQQVSAGDVLAVVDAGEPAADTNQEEQG